MRNGGFLTNQHRPLKMKHFSITAWLSALVALAAIFPDRLVAQSPQLPKEGHYWLQLYAIEQWEWDLDRDGDRRSNRQEYYEGTDPLDPTSQIRVDIGAGDGEFFVSWDGMLGSLYDFLGSADLQGFSPLLAEPLLGDGSLARGGGVRDRCDISSASELWSQGHG